MKPNTMIPIYFFLVATVVALNLDPKCELTPHENARVSNGEAFLPLPAETWSRLLTWPKLPHLFSIT